MEQGSLELERSAAAALVQIVNGAATLAERMQGLFIPDDAALADPGATEYRWQRWIDTVGNGDPQRLLRRLAWDGLDVAHAQRCLGPVRLAERRLPSWANTLAACLALGPPPDDDADDVNVPFASALWPFVDYARRRLWSEKGSKYWSNRARAAAEQSLLRILSTMAAPTLQQEFALFRHLKQSPMERVAAAAMGHPGDRLYRQFISQLSGNGLFTLLAEYPVLGRLLATQVEFWLAAMADLMGRLNDDWPALCDAFNAGVGLGNVVDAELGASDRHHGGRTVAILTFATGKRVVYKPRPVSVEDTIAQLQAWLNVRVQTRFFFPVALVDRKTYGFAGYIGGRDKWCKHRGCHGPT